MIDRFKLFRILSYIGQFEFCYETDEVRDEMDSILLDFGIDDELTVEEKSVLQSELCEMAEEFESGEVMHMLGRSFVNSRDRSGACIFYEIGPSLLSIR